MQSSLKIAVLRPYTEAKDQAAVTWMVMFAGDEPAWAKYSINDNMIEVDSWLTNKQEMP